MIYSSDSQLVQTWLHVIATSTTLPEEYTPLVIYNALTWTTCALRDAHVKPDRSDKVYTQHTQLATQPAFRRSATRI